MNLKSIILIVPLLVDCHTWARVDYCYQCDSFSSSCWNGIDMKKVKCQSRNQFACIKQRVNGGEHSTRGCAASTDCKPSYQAVSVEISCCGDNLCNGSEITRQTSMDYFYSLLIMAVAKCFWHLINK